VDTGQGLTRLAFNAGTKRPFWQYWCSVRSSIGSHMMTMYFVSQVSLKSLVVTCESQVYSWKTENGYTDGSGVYMGADECRMYWVEWKTRNARPARKSRDDNSPATGRNVKPVQSTSTVDRWTVYINSTTTSHAAGYRLWNSLPSDVVDCQTVDTFRRRLKHFFLMFLFLEISIVFLCLLYFPVDLEVFLLRPR